MNTPQNKRSNETENLKEIPKWTRKYAQNRSLTNLTMLIIFLLLFIGIAIPSYFGGMAFKAGYINIFRICIIVSFVSSICLLILSVLSIPKFGLKFWRRVDQRIYRQE